MNVEKQILRITIAKVVKMNNAHVTVNMIDILFSLITYRTRT